MLTSHDPARTSSHLTGEIVYSCIIISFVRPVSMTPIHCLPFDSSPGMDYSMWSTGQSTPSNRSDRNSVSYGSLERMPSSNKSSHLRDYLWGDSPSFKDQTYDSFDSNSSSNQFTESHLMKNSSDQRKDVSRSLFSEYEESPTPRNTASFFDGFDKAQFGYSSPVKQQHLPMSELPKMKDSPPNLQRENDSNQWHSTKVPSQMSDPAAIQAWMAQVQQHTNMSSSSLTGNGKGFRHPQNGRSPLSHHQQHQQTKQRSPEPSGRAPVPPSSNLSQPLHISTQSEPTVDANLCSQIAAMAKLHLLQQQQQQRNLAAARQQQQQRFSPLPPQQHPGSRDHSPIPIHLRQNHLHSPIWRHRHPSDASSASAEMPFSPLDYPLGLLRSGMEDFAGIPPELAMPPPPLQHRYLLFAAFLLVQKCDLDVSSFRFPPHAFPGHLPLPQFPPESYPELYLPMDPTLLHARRLPHPLVNPIDLAALMEVRPPFLPGMQQFYPSFKFHR